jgi:hypothetical protein
VNSQAEINFNFGKPPSGKTCPNTSYEAGHNFEAKAISLREQVYKFILDHGAKGATAYEVFLHFGLDKNKTSPRISELKKRGLVFDTGERRKADGCANSVVWCSVNFQGEDYDNSV